jgi:predicted metalloendopeptidase
VHRNYWIRSNVSFLGKYFVQRAFPGASKTVASQMIQSIEDAMRQDLNSLSWMDDQTRSQALTKLSLIANMIGYDSI